MGTFQVESIDAPFAADQSLMEQALRLLLRAEFVGCLPEHGAIRLGPDVVRAVGRCMHRSNLPSAHWWFVTGPAELSTSRWSEALTAMNDQIEMSPLPAGEWGPAIGTLGEDLLAKILGISTSSVRRYHAGNRHTPQDIAERLHFVALLLADLAGSYNEYGLRRWFTRPRTALDNRRPVDLLGEDFDPDGHDAQQLRDLAASLSGAGAA
jgi:uncharacterized protein (DUF2384 family)